MLPKQSKNPTAQTKRRIQALLREIAIKRDKRCVLHQLGHCNDILQAEHLNSRQYSHTYGDMRNIVLLCQYHHIFWKPQHPIEYAALIQQIVGKQRWDWLQLAILDNGRPHKMDWGLVELALIRELKSYE